MAELVPELCPARGILYSRNLHDRRIDSLSFVDFLERENVLLHREASSSGFVALRTPLLPFSTLEDWASSLSAARVPHDADLWERERRIARERLSALLDRPEIREAIFLASPSLENRIAAWRSNPDGEDGRGLEAGLVKYVSRMAARCTPFGLFAGNTTGRVGQELRLELRERGAALRHTRLGMEYLSAVVTALAHDAQLRDHLTFSTNTSLAEAGGTLRYAEARRSNGNRAYYLVDIEPHDHLRRALQRARHGASLDEIARTIADDEVSFAEATSFVHQLVEAQLLVCDLGPVVTGPESLDHLLASLSGIAAMRRVHERLAAARDAMAHLDQEGIGVAPERYRALASSLEALAPVEISRLFQVDLTKPAPAVEIPSDLGAELLRGAQVLLDLFGGARRDSLEAFRRAFEDRYGESEVSLLEALDEEIGIGFETAHHAIRGTTEMASDRFRRDARSFP